MAKTAYKSIDDYLAALDDEGRAGIQAVREAIHRALPQVEEVISYRIPAFRQHGWICYISAYKNHYALSCPPPTTVFEAFKDELDRYEKTKSQIKLPKNEPLPLALIEKMAAWRERENRKQNTKKTGKKK